MACKEQEFFNALENVFVGVPVEGESGYINLIKIKSKYYRTVIRPKLEEEINQETKPFPEVREELFDKLYDFFKRYFAENGSIGFFFTPYHETVYERVYTNEEDVVLFWKTSRLYYVKTDRLFKKMEVEVDGFKFFFDVSKLEHKKANEKRNLVFEFKELQKNGTIAFSMFYSEGNKETKINDIRRCIKDALGLKKYTEKIPSEETLQRAFQIFERQSEVDFFICKDARSFLREQFDLWMWQYLLGKPGEEPRTEWTEKRIKELQALKRIAYRVIDFIAAFEDELVKIWNKPKFVLHSNYVITVDRIFEKDPKLLEEITDHPGFASQIKEWQDLGMVGESFSKDALWEVDLTGKHLHTRYQFLPLDTRHFKDMELRILGLFENLDEALDGWLVRSENYQALNTMLPKFRGKVQCIYIDPPYNTGQSEIDYINRFKDSSWLSLLENRLYVAKEFLMTSGILCITIDHVELHNAFHLVRTVWNEGNVLGLVSIKNNPSGRSTVKGFSIANEYAIFVAASENAVIGTLPRTERQIAQYDQEDEIGKFQWRNFLRAGGGNDFRTARPKLHYPLIISGHSIRIPKMEWNNEKQLWNLTENPNPGERVIYPVVGNIEYTWRLSAGSLQNRLSDLRVRYSKTGEPIIEIKFRPDTDGVLPKTVWDDKRYNATAYGTSLLRNIMGKPQTFSFPKSVYAVEDCIRVCTSDSNAFILDFFAGSGTTAHAVINLNREDGGKRKYILVEVADYFYTVLLPRIKKVVFSDKWKDGKAQPEGKGISHFVKYYELEQYEDTLRRTKYLEDDLFTPPPYEDPCQYIFLRDPKMLEALEVNPEADKVELHLERLYEDIDLPETLSNLTGKWIKRIIPDPGDSTKPGRVEFADGEAIDLKNLDWRLIKPLIWW